MKTNLLMMKMMMAMMTMVQARRAIEEPTMKE